MEKMLIIAIIFFVIGTCLGCLVTLLSTRRISVSDYKLFISSREEKSLRLKQLEKEATELQKGY